MLWLCAKNTQCTNNCQIQCIHRIRLQKYKRDRTKYLKDFTHSLNITLILS